MTDQDLVAAMAGEMERKALEPWDVTLRPVTALQLVGLVQLALRHPGVSAELHLIGTRFIDGARAYFDGCPATLAVIERGDREG